MKKIGIIGSGAVAKALGKGFAKHGYSVMLGTRDTSKLNDWKSAAGPNAATGSVAETAAFGDIIVLAVKGDVALEVVKSLPASVSGKTIIDTSNPIDHTKTPVNGVLPFFTDYNQSLMEKLQAALPGANFVKSFSCVGSGFMVDPKFEGGKPSMFICGNNDLAKAEVKTILYQIGWEVEDMGKAEAARAIEPLCMLWCIPGFLNNQWSHAFKLLK